jgi:hypothetical protein
MKFELNHSFMCLTFFFLNLIREHHALSTYQDAISGRKRVMNDIKEIIENHPMLDGKLTIPAYKSQSLRQLLIERFHSFLFSLSSYNFIVVFFFLRKLIYSTT